MVLESILKLLSEKPELVSLFPITLFGGYRVMTKRIGPAGPGRAAVLALSSWLKPLKGPHSARTHEVNFIKNELARPNWGPKYLAVTGPKGVGKTCLIDTALTRTAGVARVTVNPGNTPEMVELNVMRAVTSADRRTDDLAPSFRRVT